MILTVVVVPDDPKPPLGRPPLVKRPETNADRDFIKPRTPVRGLPITPRQDDQPTTPAVPVEFDQPITGVHKVPELELLARVTRTQHVTEGVGVSTLSIASRLTAVESDVKLVKGQLDGQDRELATIKTGVETTNRLIGSVVDIASSKVTLEHDVTRAQIEIGGALKVDELDAVKQRRERTTALLKMALAVVTTLLGALATVHWGHC